MPRGGLRQATPCASSSATQASRRAALRLSSSGTVTMGTMTLRLPCTAARASARLEAIRQANAVATTAPKFTPSTGVARPPELAPIKPAGPVKTRQEQLVEILNLYKADKISPREYHERRARILAMGNGVPAAIVPVAPQPVVAAPAPPNRPSLDSRPPDLAKPAALLPMATAATATALWLVGCGCGRCGKLRQGVSFSFEIGRAHV